MASFLQRHLPVSSTVRPIHAITYLLGVAFFSISFLVFVNSSISFVLTDLLNITGPIGKIVGVLGFADELVAIVAAPIWGVLSDGYMGTRGVVVCGYGLIALSLVFFVSVSVVYPGLLLSRMLFSVGASAVATMVSAILPEMTVANGGGEGARHSTGKLAGLVGLFTGLGAVLAVGVFLPLPTRYLHGNVGRGEAVREAYYTVAMTALVVGVWCLFALPAQRQQGRGVRGYGYTAKRWLWARVWGGDPASFSAPSPPPPTKSRSGLQNLTAAVNAARQDSRLLLAYISGFVARSTSIGISLFIPLLVNHHFKSTGRCPTSPDTADPNHGCKRAYILSSQLTGTSQLTALLLAPLFGYFTDHPPFNSHRNTPLVLSGICGVVGFTTFGILPSPEPGQYPVIWLSAALMGVAQIGGIVCSLGILGRGIVSPDHTITSTAAAITTSEATPLIDGRDAKKNIKGGIAGVYSLSGGVGILAMTLAGGAGFDGVAPGWPFWMLATFEAGLVVAAVAEGVWGGRRRRRHRG